MIILIIINLIKTFILSFVIAKFSPQSLKTIKGVRDGLVDSLPDNIFKWSLQDVMYDLDTLLNCLKCISFWTGFILTGSIWMGCLSYLISFWYLVLISRYEIQRLS